MKKMGPEKKSRSLKSLDNQGSTVLLFSSQKYITQYPCFLKNIEAMCSFSSLVEINGINGRTILIYSNYQIVMLTQGNAHSYSVPPFGVNIKTMFNNDNS